MPAIVGGTNTNGAPIRHSDSHEPRNQVQGRALPKIGTSHKGFPPNPPPKVLTSKFLPRYVLVFMPHLAVWDKDELWMNLEFSSYLPWFKPIKTSPGLTVRFENSFCRRTCIRSGDFVNC